MAKQVDADRDVARAQARLHAFPHEAADFVNNLEAFHFVRQE